eukprot:SAG11_NODE_7285_length_1166_cov_1.484536_1_plen_42_part_10
MRVQMLLEDTWGTRIATATDTSEAWTTFEARCLIRTGFFATE